MTGEILAQTAEFTSTTTGEATTFWILAPVAVLAAMGMVLARSAVHAALLLVVNLFCVAVFYMIQEAPFLGFVQIVVYTGAIMVLFLFVLMLVGVDSSDSLVETLRGQRLAAIVLGLGFAGLLVFPVGAIVGDTSAAGLEAANSEGNVQGIAKLLFTDYIFAFEAISALLVVAAVGAMVLGHRQREGGKINQRDMMRRRFDGGGRLTPLPGPGVYAGPGGGNQPARLPSGELAAGSSMGNPADDSRADDSGPTTAGRRLGRARGASRRCRAQRFDPRRHRHWHWNRKGNVPVNPANYLILSGLLFTIGAVGVLSRRNAIVVFMCIELMLNSVNLTLVTFSRIHGTLDGQIMAFFVMTVAAAEVVVGLAVILTIFRTRRSSSVDDVNLLKY